MAAEGRSESLSLVTPSLTVAALIVSGGFLASRVVGLLRSVIIAGSFGTSPELDAYWVAFRLPDLVFQLLAGATLASAFIPTFAGMRQQKGDEAAWRLASSVLNLVLLATVAFAIIAFILAPVLVPLMAPGLGEESGRQAELRSLAIDLTRVMLISPILFAVSGMFMGILNARRRFLTPALAPVMYNLSIIGAALISQDVKVLAVGVVVGAALHLAVQLPELRLTGMKYGWVAEWKDVAVREVARLMGPRVLGLAASQINFYFVAIFFASTLQDGAISAVNFAWLIVMTPLGVIGMAISTAAFPTMAEQAAERDWQRLNETLSRALRLILYLSVPIGLGLMLLAKPLVAVLLQRGEFDAASTDLTSQALIFYSLALFAYGAIEILSRGFYALGDTRTPVTIAIGAMLCNLTLAAILVGPFEVKGLALALSLTTMVECGILFIALTRRLPDLISRPLKQSLLQTALAAGLMAIVLGAMRTLLRDAFNLESSTEALIMLLLCGGAGGVFYLATSFAIGSEEPRLLLAKAGRWRGAKRAEAGS